RTIRGVLDDVDPRGRSVTPVVKLSPPGTGAPATLAVVPDQFRHIGLFPAQDRARIRWQALDPRSQGPIRLLGTHLTGRISTASLGVTGPGGDVPPTVTLDLVDGRNGTLGAPRGRAATASPTRAPPAPSATAGEAACCPASASPPHPAARSPERSRSPGCA